MDLKPDAIVLLTEKPNIIAIRRKQRDNVNLNEIEIQDFQNEEVNYATEVAETLNIPLKVSTGEDDLNNTLDFIREIIIRPN